MGRGGLNQKDVADCEYSWEEIQQHSKKTDRWIVVDGQVYDVTRFAKRHPGGEKIMQGYAGQDASVSN
jgi:fatty acid desaturase 2 (delta-6 desaturase)